MGGYLSQPVPIIADKCLLKYRTAIFDDIDECAQIMIEQMDRPLSVNREEFQSMLGLYFVDTKEHFDLWKGEGDEVDVLRVFCGAYLHCQCTLERKIHGIFDLFVDTGSNTLGWDDLAILLMSCHRGLSVLAGIEPEEKRVVVEVDRVLDRAFKDLTMGDPREVQISSYAFYEWVQEYYPLMTHYKKYLNKDITTLLAQTHAQLSRVEEGYDELEILHGALEVDHLVHPLFTDHVDGLSNNDVTALCALFEAPENRTKETVIRGVRVCVVFDAIDCNRTKRLKVNVFGKALIWMMDGFEPTHGRVEYMINSLLKFHKRSGTMATSKHETISRAQWRQFMLDSERMMQFQKEVFKDTLRECYILTDQHRRKRLFKTEVAQMVKAALIAYVNASIADGGLQVLESLAVQIVEELWETVSPPIQPADALGWPIIHKYLTLLHAKCIAVVEWFHAFICSRYAGIFKFMADGSVFIATDLLTSKLQPMIGEMVTQQRIAQNDAKSLLEITACNIITRLDLELGEKSNSILSYQHLSAIKYMEDALTSELQDRKDNHRQEAKLTAHMVTIVKTPHLSRMRSLDKLQSHKSKTEDFYDDIPEAKINVGSIDFASMNFLSV